jgi:hypothetical protein
VKGSEETHYVTTTYAIIIEVCNTVLYCSNSVDNPALLPTNPIHRRLHTEHIRKGLKMVISIINLGYLFALARIPGCEKVFKGFSSLRPKSRWIIGLTK